MTLGARSAPLPITDSLLANFQLARKVALGPLPSPSRLPKDGSEPIKSDESGVRGIAKIFTEHDVSVWIEAAGYAQKKVKRQPAAARPVAPLLVTLPFGDLSFEQFQGFCRMLLDSLYPEAKVNQFGTQGDTQDGIDIELRFPDGRYFTYSANESKSSDPPI